MTEHKKTKDDEVITISQVTLWQGISGVLALFLIISVFTGGFGIGKASMPTQPTNVPEDTVNMDALIENDAILGDKNAPVTIVEFSDYECPYCARFQSETLSLIKEQYIDTGKVRLIYRDFPLSFHPNAQKAAEAAECAGDQGKYYEMHDMLFENGVSGGVSQYKQYAKQIDLDEAEFASCLDSGKHVSEIQSDFRDGQTVGITGTPGFIINGQLVVGAQPFPVFQQIIESALN